MIDLHCHSTFSDGKDSPEQLVELAAERGIQAISLTDHDTCDGIRPLIRAARLRGITAVPGVEISTNYRPGMLHMLGYFVDSDSAFLNEHLDWMRAGRDARNEELFHRLNSLGYSLRWDEIRALAGNGVMGRPHFAEAMVRRGYAPDMETVFKKLLSRRGGAYVARRSLSPENSIELIRRGGGVPVLAHAHTLGLKRWRLLALLRSLKEAGLEGVEVYYPAHEPDFMRQLLRMTRDLDLVATGGSDYHGIASEHGSGLGEGPAGSLDLEVVRQLQDRCR